MCGILGYCGPRDPSTTLMSGLRRLEYRGYDSAGLCIGQECHSGQDSPDTGNTLQIVKRVGKIRNLQDALPVSLGGSWGIGHTRWATHGTISDQNAHPHSSCDGRLAICHNGIIENYAALKNHLTAEGHEFVSDTDSEVIAHLIESFYSGDLEAAVRSALSLLEGTYGILAVHADHAHTIIGARSGSPMVLGLGSGEMFIASDVSAMAAHTRQVVYIEDGEIIVMNSRDYTITDTRNRPVDKAVETVSWEIGEMERGSYPHYMIKEIHEQVDTIPRAMSGRIDEDQATAVLGGLDMSERELLGVRRVVIFAAGTSNYAARVAAYLIESVARIPAAAEAASELRYRNPLVEEGTLYFAVSQSGETLDTLMALRELRRKGARVLGICNVVGSSIARESDGGIYIHSGPEIAVASTKAFTSQLAALYLFALKMARMRHMDWPQGRRFIEGLQAVPGLVGEILADHSAVRLLAGKYSGAASFLFLGRGLNYPVALEGALKLKEIAYIHAEGYSAAEIKHGPIALINSQTPSLFIVPDDRLNRKIISNMKEVKSRGGPVVALCAGDNAEAVDIADDVIFVPHADEEFYPFLMAVPLQLFAYYCALELERDVDQPRNLAKSVTVE